jgi:hypothetical protein
MWNSSILRRTDTRLGRPKSLQVEEDKVLTDVIVSVIYRIMSLPGKDIGGGIGYPTRPSQSKGTSSRLGGRELEKSKIIFCSEGEVLEMPRTWHIRYRTRTRTRRVGSTKKLHWRDRFLRLVTLKEKSGVDQRFH